MKSYEEMIEIDWLNLRLAAPMETLQRPPGRPYPHESPNPKRDIST